MKVQLAPGWSMELEHGPEWLFVKLFGPEDDDAESAGLAECLLLLLQEELTQRLVLELDAVDVVDEEFLGELLQLYDRLESAGGLLRLCGIASHQQPLLRDFDGICRLPYFRDRHEAVMGFFRPGKPR
jgi:hypothetical protein